MKAKLNLLVVTILTFCTILFGQVQPDKSQLSSLQELNAKYNNGINIIWNRKNGSPKIISFSTPISFDKNQENSSRKLMKEISGLLKYRMNTDTLVIIKQNENKGITYLRFQQKYKGIPVKGGGYAVTVLNEGKIQAALGTFYSDILIDTKPTLSVNRTLEAVLLNLPEDGLLKNSYESCRLIIYPKDDKYYLAYEMRIKNIKEDVTWSYFVNSLTGEILEKHDDVINAQCYVYQRHPGLDASYSTISPLSNAYNNGYLQGTYTDVINDESSRAYSASNDFRYSTSDTHFDEGNLYYHVDRIANYFRNLGFNEFTQITTAAHHDFFYGGNPSPNAGYFDTDLSIRFSDGQGVPGYNSFAREDKVIYHEYTHAVMDYIGPGLSDLNDEFGAITEGNADYYAGSFTGRSLIGEYVCSFYNRDAADPGIATYSQYDESDKDLYAGGEFWSACLWDLRNSLTASVADRIIYEGLKALPENPDFEFYRWTILYADMNYYGGAHLNTIKHAFYLRGIGTDAVTTSGTLQSNETWTEYVTLSGPGDVIVPAGVTLTIASNVVVNLNSRSILSTGGTINLSPSATINGLKAKLSYSNILKGLFPSIQSAVNNAQTGYCVDLLADTYSENVSVSSKNNVTIYGTNYTNLTGTFSLYGCSNLTMLMSTYNQVNSYYSDDCTFNCNFSGSSSQTGLGLYNCTDFTQTGGNILGFNTGLSAVSSSGVSELSNFTSSYCNISASSGTNIQYAYSNSYCEPVSFDFRAASSSYIYSMNSYFESGHPITYTSGNSIFINTGRIDCLTKKSDNTALQDIQPSEIQSYDPVVVEFSKLNAIYFSLLKKIKENKEKGIEDNGELKNQFLNIVKDFKEFIKKYPNSSLSRVILTTAANSFRLFNEINNSENFLEEIITNKELTSLKGAAEILMIDYYRNVKDFNNAISQADAVINKYNEDSELSCDAIFKKGLLLSYEMKQSEKAAECFTSILKNYPDNTIAGFAENQLNVLGYDVQKDEGNLRLTDKSEFTSGAYPNPFNPSTTIRFNLPEEGKVIVKVFDILGREVAVLLNDYMQTGSHNVVWSGKDSYGSEVSSGVYFYNIRYNDQSLTKKKMLVR